jgi:cell wall-associated NlpC family hydrolase
MQRQRALTRCSARGAALAATAVLAVLVAQAPAGATPTGTTPAGTAPAGTAGAAQDRVEQSGQQVEELGEQVNEAQQAVADQRAAADAAARTAADAQAALTAMQPQVRAIAATGFAGGNSSRVAAFLTSGSIDDLVQQMTTLDLIADHADGVLAQYAKVGADARAAQQAAADAAGQAQRTLEDLEAKQRAARTQLDRYQADYAALSQPQQAAVDDALVGPALAAPVTPAPAPSAAAGVAVKTALAQVGDPYVSGAAGPDRFDCSGLSMYAYAAAGVTLPHSSRAQSTMGTPVARNALEPGDLVFYYSPVSHVGIYVGGGMMVHAPVPGQDVVVTSVDKPGYVGARRVTGG